MDQKNVYTTKVLDRIVTQLRRFPVSKKYIDIVLQDKDINELAKGSSVAFVFKALSLPIGLATSLIISRWYGAEAMGLYGLVITIVWMLVSIWMLWLGAAMPRFLGESRAQESDQEQSIYRTSMRMILLSWLLCSCVLYFWSWYIATWIFDEPKLLFPIQITSLFLLPFLIQKLNTSFLLGTKNVYYSELINNVLMPWVLLLLVFLSYRVWPTFYIPIRAYLIAWCIGMTVSLYILVRCKNISIRGKLHSRKSLITVSGPMLITGIAGMIIWYSDILMLWWLWETQEVGVYKVASSLAILVLIVPLTLQSVISPYISEEYRKWKLQNVQRLLLIFVRVVIPLSFCIFIVLLLFAEQILLLFSQEFIMGALSLKLLAVAWFFNNLNGMNGWYLGLSGRERQEKDILIVMCILNIALNYKMIPLRWINWAALASLITIIIHNIYLTVYIRHLDNVKTFLH